MPGAWEIVAERRNRVLIGIIHAPDWPVSLTWAQRLRELATPPGSQILGSRGLPYGHARNEIIKHADENEFPWIFYLDTDVEVPAQGLMTLLATGLDVVAGEYSKRHPPFPSAHGNSSTGDDSKIKAQSIPEQGNVGLVPADMLAAGALLVSRRCFIRVREAFPRPFEWGLDIAPVPAEGGGYLEEASEDYMFSLRANRLGFRTYVHTGVLCRHELMVVAKSASLETLG